MKHPPHTSNVFVTSREYRYIAGIDTRTYVSVGELATPTAPTGKIANLISEPRARTLDSRS